ncbi:MAG: CHAT domain-containing protein [Cyanobacteria bacterium J06643_4]
MKKRLRRWTSRVARLCAAPVAWVAGVAATLVPMAKSPAQAQVVPTAGGAGTTVSESNGQFDIEGGTQAGGNLFHEFNEFSLDQTETANFLSDSSVFNIVGQISGANPSYIDGTVQVSGSDANLYLVNPSGVLFGPNAQLSLSGSFTATTADQVEFEGDVLNVLNQGADYSAFDGDLSALHFTETSASAVVNQADLSVAPGESISLVGGTFVNAGEVNASGGEIGLVAVSGGSTLRYNLPGSLLSLEVTNSSLPAGSFAVADVPALITGSPSSVASSLEVRGDGFAYLQGTRVEPGETATTGTISTAATLDAGGNIALLGASVDVLGATVDASGASGGQIRIGGDGSGGGSLPRADVILINSISEIRSDGLSGAGGDIALWSDDRAFIRGDISASGVTSGGRIETSAAQLNLANVALDASGGDASGQWVVGPAEIEIVNGVSGFNRIDPSLIEATLDGNTNVEIATTAGLGGNGDIVLRDSINQTGGGTANLTLSGRRFDANGSTIGLASTGQLTFNLNQVNAEATPDSSSIAEAISAVGTVNGRRLIGLGAGDYSFANEIAVGTAVDLQGAGIGNTTLTMLGNDRHFSVGAGSALSLQDLTVTTAGLGAGQRGGGIFSQGRLTVETTEFVDNRAVSGGAIAAVNASALLPAVLTVADTAFRNNSATDGGAIALADVANADISAALLERNSATDSGGGISAANSTVAIAASTFDRNDATIRGGGIHASDSAVTITAGSTFDANRSITNDGGGVSLIGASGTGVIDNVTFTNNVAAVDGGGIFISHDAQATVRNGSRFLDNSVGDDGGGIYVSQRSTLTLRDAELRRNVAGSGGGGMHVSYGATVTAADITVRDNTGRNGGGISLYEGRADIAGTTVIADNRATRDGGGLRAAGRSQVALSDDVALIGNQAADDGGGLFIADSSTGQIDSAQVVGNTAGNDGGGLYIFSDSNADVRNTRLENNRAIEAGGGLSVSFGSHATVTATAFDNNRARFGGGLRVRDATASVIGSQNRDVTNNRASVQGGGAFINNSNVILRAVEIADNDAATDGGAIALAGTSVLALSTAAFNDNTAGNQGGALYSEASGELVVESSTLAENEATSGAGLFNQGTATLTNSTFSGNVASDRGGAIASDGPSAQLTLRNSTLTQNLANSTGGGISVRNTQAARLLNTIVAGNSSPIGRDVSGQYTDQGNNLIGVGDGATGFTNSSLVGSAPSPVDPGLEALADNGGPTKTHLLRADSLALDAGSALNLPAVDQRGQVRFFGSGVDIGAVELGAAALPTPPASPSIPALSISSLDGALFDPTLSTTGSRHTKALAIARADHDLAEANQEIRQLERSFGQGFEDYWDLATGPALTFEEVQSILRRAQDEYEVNSAVVYAAFAPESSTRENDNEDSILQVDSAPSGEDLLNLSVVLPAGELVSYQLPVTRSQASRQVRLLRSAVSDPDDRVGYRPLTRQLYQWLLAPLEEDLAAQNIHNLMYALDDGLRTAPIAAMRDYQGFSLERYGISVVPSVGLMQADFPMSVRRSTVAMGISEFVSDQPLPAVPVELEAVKAIVPVSQTILNEGSTVQALASVQALEQPGVLHLATHATFDNRSADSSYIQMWDQPLSMKEFSTLGWGDSDLELLILSACSTALSGRNSELGFAGLAAAAGVDATVGSLWEVSDVGTLALMREFYAQLEATDVRFEALRQAQLSLLRGNTRIEGGDLVTDQGKIDLPDDWDLPDSATLDHPFFWSAFTMIGNPW